MSEDTVDRLVRDAASDAEQLAPRPARARAAGGERPMERRLPEDVVPGLRLDGEPRHGGQGFVYRAIQLSTKKCVAVKFLSCAAPGHTGWARQARECDILAELNHPQIVGIRDSGVADGLRYLVMDYVDGTALDAYVARHAPTMPATLRLFASVCDAVNAAHLRGVIHRDLKPSNVLVDVTGMPHVLDFGLAKFVVDDSGSDRLTCDGQFLGSVPWASPEQAAGRNADIDMRADVYSLGIILYHLLTGGFPYDTGGPWRLVLHRIQNENPRPLRPARRAGGGYPWSSPLAGSINNEVEMIVLKCIAKEPERRYQTAGEVARDVRRLLAGEPIEAKRDSIGYIVCKLVRRHLWAVAATLALVAVATTGGLVSLTQWRTAAAERDRAEASVRTTEAVEQQMTDLLANLPRLTLDTGDVAAMEHLLDERLAALEPILQRQPEMALRIRSAFAAIYDSLGRPGAGEAQAWAALQAAHVADRHDSHAAARALMLCARFRIAARDYERAEALLMQAAQIFERSPGPLAPHYIVALGQLANVTEATGELERTEWILRRILNVVRRSDLDVGSGTKALAEFLSRRGPTRYTEAEQLHRQALLLAREGGDELVLADRLHSFGVLLCHMRRSAEAVQILQEAVETRQRLIPAVDSIHLYYRLFSEVWLGIALLQEGRTEEAEPLLISYFEIESAVWDRGGGEPSQIEALAAIVNAYEALDATPGRADAEKVAAWRGKLEALTGRPGAAFKDRGQ